VDVVQEGAGGKKAKFRHLSKSEDLESLWGSEEMRKPALYIRFQGRFPICFFCFFLRAARALSLL
jgi:hypothetical protein